MIRVAMNNKIYRFCHRCDRNIAAFLILYLGIFRIYLLRLVIVGKKRENSQLHRRDLCFRRLGLYTAPYKQSAPSLTIHCAMSRPEPVVSGSCQLYLADLE